MSDTPRTDALEDFDFYVMRNHARELERELDQAHEEWMREHERDEQYAIQLRDLLDYALASRDDWSETFKSLARAALAKNPTEGPGTQAGSGGQRPALPPAVELTVECPPCVYRDGCRVGLACQAAGCCQARQVEEKFTGRALDRPLKCQHGRTYSEPCELCQPHRGDDALTGRKHG